MPRKEAKSKRLKVVVAEPQSEEVATHPPHRVGAIALELLDELWSGESPFLFADPRQVDQGYPSTNIQVDLVEAILNEVQPRFWLEIGSMLGGSAIVTADAIKRLSLDTGICCVDPFTGDVNMWAWEKGFREKDEWRYLKLEAGRPMIYERFLANVRQAGHHDLIVPILCTTMVGLRLIRDLVQHGRLSQLPEVIYLDSAHEPEETLLELRSSWATLAPGGVLFGDDWLWPSVRDDVRAFSRLVNPDTTRMVAFLRRFEESQLDGNVFLDGGHWVLFKSPD